MTSRICLLIILLAGGGGCTSIKSTMLNRTDPDQLLGNSNGMPGKHCQTRPFKGVPITVRVPTHVDVAIREKIRFHLVDGELYRLETSHRHLTVDPTLIYTDKVFTVDVKRPAAGTSDYTLEFGDNKGDLDNHQYFKNIKNKIVDETIQDVTAAIETVFSAIPTSTGDERLNQQLTTAYFEEYRTVAWQRFDLDADGFEQLVAAFVEQHLNCCNSCLEYIPNNSLKPHVDHPSREIVPALISPVAPSLSPSQSAR